MLLRIPGNGTLAKRSATGIFYLFPSLYDFVHRLLSLSLPLSTRKALLFPPYMHNAERSNGFLSFFARDQERAIH